MSIQKKMLLWLSGVLLVFVVGVNVVMVYLLREIAEREAIQEVHNGLVARQRFDEQRRTLMATQAKAIADIPYLKATLTIPNVDRATVAATVTGVADLVDVELLVIGDSAGDTMIGMLADGREVDDPGFVDFGRQTNPGAAGFEYLRLGRHLYGLTVAEIAVGPAVAGYVGIGQRIDSQANLALTGEVSGTRVAVVSGDRINRLVGEPGDGSTPLTDAILANYRSSLAPNAAGAVSIVTDASSDMSYAIASVDHPGADARTVLYRPIDLVESSAYFAWSLLAMGSLLAIALGIGVSQLVATWIGRPIVALTEAARRFGRGQLDVRIVPQGSDEVGRLAHAFNQMASDLVHSRADLIESKNAAEAASRAKSEFLARMSHEMRTPMNGILGMTDLIAKSGLNDTQARYEKIIRQSGRSLLSIIDDMLDFSNVESGKITVSSKPFKLRQVASDAIALLRPSADAKELSLKCDLDGVADRTFAGDPDLIGQIIVNLVANAVKFTPNGEITVTVVETGGDADACNIRVAVSDTGIGIRPEHRQRIFEMFYQVDGSSTREYDGTGLGLAICAQLVELMGGEIGVDSVFGQGTEFWFTLCLAKSDEQLVDTGDLLEDQICDTPVELGYDILLVEDNLVNQNVAQLMLDQLGCRTVLVENGVEAVDKYRNRRWNAVLMDCQMPLMDGFEATAKIRKLEEGANGPCTPIIALTAYALKGDAQRCLDAGMTGYLSKPFTLSQLSQVLVANVEPHAASHRVVRPADAGDASHELPTLRMDPLDELREFQVPGGPDVVAEIVGTFFETANSSMSDIVSGMASQDTEAIRAAAHKFKGSCSSIGGDKLASECAELHEAALSQDLPLVAETIANLRDEFRRLVHALEAYAEAG